MNFLFPYLSMLLHENVEWLSGLGQSVDGVLFPAGINLPKNPGDGGDPPVLISSRHSLAY